MVTIKVEKPACKPFLYTRGHAHRRKKGFFIFGIRRVFNVFTFLTFCFPVAKIFILINCEIN